jgi:hypothetical protein
MHLASAARRPLVVLSCFAFIATCALIIFPRHGPTSLCSAPQKCTALTLFDDSAEIAAAKASIEHEAYLRHQKIQDAMDNAEALGNTVAARMRMQAAAFLARMRSKVNTTINDSSPSSASFQSLNLFVSLLWVCSCAF